MVGLRFLVSRPGLNGQMAKVVQGLDDNMRVGVELTRGGERMSVRIGCLHSFPSFGSGVK